MKKTLRETFYILILFALGTVSCQSDKEELDTQYYVETDLSFFDPYNTDYTYSTWIRKPENIKIANETFKKIGYKRFFVRYSYSSDWCWALGDVNKPCNEIIDSLLLTYNADTIQSKYYREFWNRRKAENNDQIVFKVLQEVAAIILNDSIITHDDNYVNDTLYQLIEIREFDDSITNQKARQNFDYLKNIGLHQSAYNLLYERYRYYDIKWNQDELKKSLRTDTINCCPWAWVEDDTK